MDRALDDIVAERHRNDSRRRRGGRRNDRNDYPRDGIRKVHTAPPCYEWVHDKFDDDSSRRPARSARRYSPEPARTTTETGATKLRVENIHYELTEEDMEGLFSRIGPVAKLSLLYDRSGRSEGIAFVTYESARDAQRAIREFDGANANGQPIRLIAIQPSRARNPFDSAVRPARPLEDRITRARSDSPIRRSDVSGPAPPNVDRYVPGQGSRSRSPLPRRREGRPPGFRRERPERAERPERGGRGGREGGTGRRPRKTQEELDAEMDDYFGGGGSKTNGGSGVAPAAAAAVPQDDDIEMAE